VIQLLRNSSGQHFVWTRWGRVGESGQNGLQPCGDLASGVKAFESKFKDKTKNQWANRGDFVKHNDKYDLVETAEDGEGDGDGDSGAPLGRLSKGQIEKGQKVLEELRAALESGNKKAAGDFSARYYTLIPTVVGRAVAPVISSLPMLQEKEELLKFLLRMGFDEIDEADVGLSPIDGVLDLPLPQSLLEAAMGVTSQQEIKSANERGKTLAQQQAGKPQKKMEEHLYAAISESHTQTLEDAICLCIFTRCS
jgi:predicted DNA-binding WGR domain protein